MKTRPVGIVDPFNEPKKQKPPIPSPYEDPYGMATEEQHLRPSPTLDLDGESYVIRFMGGTTPENMRSALIELLYEVNAAHKAHLNQHGIFVGSDLQHNCMKLSYQDKTVHVYMDAPSEVAVFRRIGSTLWSLPDKKVLKKHQVKIIKRG